MANAVAAMLGGRRLSAVWPGLRVEYSWLPPFEGEAVTTPNRLEVVFSGHPHVELGHDGRVHRVAVQPGAGYVVGEAPTVLRRVAEVSDTLEIYPDLALVRQEAEREGVSRFEFAPSLGAERTVSFRRDPLLLGIAHRLRRAVMGRLTISEMEASGMAHQLARQAVARQYRLPERAASRLDARALARIAEAVEARLATPPTLEELAALAGLSPYHFARSFRAATGLAPHQFVLARRIELAKRLVIGTRMPVQKVAWETGFENLSHFRRQFAAQVGVLPGELRQATSPPRRPPSPVRAMGDAGYPTMRT